MNLPKIINAIGGGVKLYLNLIYVGAAGYAIYLLIVDLLR